MNRKWKRMTACALAAVVAATSFGIPGAKKEAEAAYTTGNAPYINTWLVAGPSDTSVTDAIYEDVAAPVERPEDGNWARVAKVSATSSWQNGPYSYPDRTDSPSAKNNVDKAVDGDKNTCWLAQMHDAEGAPESWPKWDPAPTYYLEWKTPIQVKTVEFFDRYDSGWGDRHISEIEEVKVTLKNAKDEVLAEQTVTDINHKGETPGVAAFDTAVQDVSKIELLIVHDGVKDLRNVGLGFSEINVFDGEKTEEPGQGEDPEGTKLEVSSASASTTLSGSSASYAVDGDMDTAWKSDTRQGIVWDDALTLTLDLAEVAQITQIKINGFERDNKQLNVTYTLLDEDGAPIKEVSQSSIVNTDFTATAITKAYNVKTVKAKIRETGGAPNHLGIKEIEVYGIAGKTEAPEEPEEEPAIQISPKLGDTFGDARWEYFDDRIFNRNLDDWQDLYGYYTVKKGISTENKYVYAHTYVYSPKKQTVNLRMVTSGLHKVYVNDKLVHQNDTAVESSNKDQYRQSVTLKEGWNKLLIEVQHTRVHYLGFYARLCDKDGNEVKDLIYSVMGDQEESLQIVTQGLDIDRTAFEERNQEIPSNMYPENELPYGYTQWPYVWNKPIHRTNNWAPQASGFRFQAAGGAPAYTWEIVEGQLPDGLTMDDNGVLDGYCETAGEYPFTLQVTDAEGRTATKTTKIVVKERPNKWFEEGKMSALSHDTGAYAQFYDENFSYDLWAERAKKAGMTLLSTEALQAVYYWPGPGATNANLQHPYTLEEVDGKLQPKDMVKLAKEAAERHGLRFGVYYASEGSNRLPNGHTNNSSGFFANVEDLMKRYDPSYLFFDGGPQGKGNVDAMWSAVRAYNDYALIQANDQNEAGDNDLTILETEYTGKMPYVHGGYWETNMLNQNKYTVEEAWTHPFFQEIGVWAQYAGGNMRDDWRLFAEYIIYSIGHGIVPNYDQMIVNTRGVNWSGIGFAAGSKDEYYYLPLNAQQMIDMRDKVNAWMANEGKPDLHESLFGTMPYYFDTYEKKAGWHENTEKEPFLTAKYGEGPDWGYTVARNQYIYMHMQENTMGAGRAKVGFTGQESMEVGPFTDKVLHVEWLNEGRELGFTTSTRDGKNYITIDTSAVKADPVDTIIKITTDSDKRDFTLTSVKLFGEQTKTTELQLRAEAYLKTYTNVFAPAQLTYTSSNTNVAKVDANGLVTPVGAGKATIQVVAEYEGVQASDTYAVKVDAAGNISVDEELIGVVMRTAGKETFGKFSTNKNLPITFEARTEKGGGVNVLSYDDVTYHYAVCYGQKDGHVAEADGYWKDHEVDNLNGLLKIIEDEVVFNGVIPEEENVAIWADITIDGKTYTTNKNFLRLVRSGVLNENIVPEVSSNEADAAAVTDGILNSADGGNTSRWTPDQRDQNPTMTFELEKEYTVDGVRVFYNNKDRKYLNTPKEIQIEISSDNKEWTTVVEAGGVPSASTIYCYEDEKYTYDVNAKAKYVRVTFPEGAADSVMDILEVQILGVDLAAVLSEIEVTKTPGADGKELALEVTGYTGQGEVLDLTDGTVTITSDNQAVATVNGNTVKAAGQGTAKITVQASLSGFEASQVFYVKVGEDGGLVLTDYLKSIAVSLDSTILDNGAHNKIKADISGKWNTGEAVDLSGAKITCECSSEKLTYNAADGTITVKGTIDTNEMATVRFTVTVDGVALESQNFDLALVASTFNVPGRIEAEDGIIEGERVRGESGDGGTALGYIMEGDVYTYFVNVEEAGVYEVYYRAVAEQMDKRIRFYVNGELQGNMRFTEAGDWTTFTTQKQEDLVQLKNGLNIITLKPQGGGYICNLNWLEFVKVADIEEPVEDPANKYLLQRTYDYAVTLNTDGVAESAKAYFEKTLAEAKAVLENEKATQDQVNAAWDNLLDGIWSLGIYKGEKGALKELIDQAKAMNKDDYEVENWGMLEEALAKAEAVYADEDATQDIVDAAKEELQKAIDAQVLKPVVDKSILKQLIDKATAMLPDEERYMADNWPKLTAALEKGQSVYENEEATQEAVNAAADELLGAIMAQRFKANKSNLEKLVKEAEGVDTARYTAETVKVFQAALTKAKAVLADETLSESEQKIVDDAAKVLAEAKAALQEKDNTGDGTKDDGKDSPKTGDTAPMALWGMIAMLAVALITGFEKKKWNRNLR